MGYTLVPIAIELNRLATALGSGDERLLSAVVRRYRGEFEQIDDMAAEFFEDEDLDSAFTVKDALRQVVMGEAYRRERGLWGERGHNTQPIGIYDFVTKIPQEYEMRLV